MQFHMRVIISDDDIAYAESILLQGDVFDKQRRDFIKDLTTLDVQAVPGSGKTTALLAKLLILERKLPLEASRGILILSHTNSAVDEIKEKNRSLLYETFLTQTSLAQFKVL